MNDFIKVTRSAHFSDYPKCKFLYSYAAVDRILTDVVCRRASCYLFLLLRVTLIMPAPARETGGLPPIEKLPPRATAWEGLITCPSYAYPVVTVVFDANNHEAN